MSITEPENLYARFKAKAEAVSAQVYRVPDMEKAGELITELLHELKVNRVVVSHSSLSMTAKLDEKLMAAKMSVDTKDLRLRAPQADAGISQMDMAIAESGTLAQDATNVDARLVSSLPLIHVALVPLNALKATLEDAMLAFYERGVPGHLSFITGPSRTSDIERVLTIGVHGPEILLIVFVEQGGEA